MMRLMLYDRANRPLGELSTDTGTLDSCDMTLEINGEHSLSVTTSVHLLEGTRALFRDKAGRWREFVVDEMDEDHSSGLHAKGTYHLIWSLQYDLQWVRANDVRQPGLSSPCTASKALSEALSGTRRWTVGTVDVTTKSGVLMAFDSAWDRLNSVVKYWGGNVDDEIEVGPDGVTHRKVLLLEHQGSREAVRRLEWRHDLTSVSRNAPPGPYYCRVIPYGNGEQEIADDDSTFEWKLDITSVNGGVAYLSNPETEPVFRTMNPDGTWEYPTTSVDYSTDDPYELLQMAREDLPAHTDPTPSYEATVSQFAESGMDVDGISLGDEVQILDYGFNPDRELREQERVLRIEEDLLGVQDTRLTIGRLQQTLERTMGNLIQAVGPQIAAIQLSPYVASDYPISVPEHPTYTITAPDGIEYTVPTYDIPSVSDAIADLDMRTGDVETVVASGMDYDPVTESYVPAETASSASDGGHSIKHILDGVEITTGSIVFITEGESLQQPTSDQTQQDPTKWGTGTSSVHHGGKISYHPKNAKKIIAVTAANISGSKPVNVAAKTSDELWGVTNATDPNGNKIRLKDGVLFASL